MSPLDSADSVPDSGSPLPALPSFNSVQEALRVFESLGEAAQTHGLLCAFFACGVKLRRQAWLNSLMVQTPDKAELIEMDSQEILTQLFVATQEAFLQEEPWMDPLLPSDDAPLVERIEALAEFSKGFVMGLNLTGIPLKNNPNELLQEAFDDFINISCLAPQDEEGEESERAFVELVEYLRIAMMQIYWELKSDVGHDTTQH